MRDKPERGFKKKTIRQTMKHKVAAWLKSIDDEELRERMQNSVIVTGGAITSMLLGEYPNDFDVYFKDKDVAVDVANYYVMKNLGESKDSFNEKVGQVHALETDIGVQIYIKSAGLVDCENENGLEGYTYFEAMPQDAIEEYFKPKKENLDAKKETYKPLFITGNAITLSNDIQIILRFVGDAETIHSYFDFIHCTNWYDYATNTVHLNADAMETTLAKELRYHGSKYPICSLFRIRKFIKRGWSISAAEVFKIAWDASQLNLSDSHVLRDQLMGVDYAYFREVVNILSKNEKEGKALDRTYLFELLTRVFDEADIPDHDEYSGEKKEGG